MGTASPAVADDPGEPNAASAFAINVPSSLLADTSSDPANRTQLASAFDYNWYFSDPSLAQVSGTLTSSPSAPSSVLSGAALAEFAAATAPAAIPATAPARVVRPPTFASTSANVAILGFVAGVLIGQNGARLFGFTDDQVCAENNDVLNAFAGVLDGVSCDVYENQMNLVQRDADQVPVTAFDPVTVHGVTAEYLGGVPYTGDANYLTCFKWTGTRPGSSWRIQVQVWGANNSFSYSGASESNSYCPSPSNLSGWWVKAPLLKYQLEVFNPYTYPNDYYSSAVIEGDVSYPATQRQWKCVITTNVGVYTKLSDYFTEQDPTLAAIECPAVPPGEIVQHVKIYELGGYSNHVVLDQDSTSAYSYVAANYPECLNGSCLLDLRKSGVSCFRLADPTDCDGWRAAPLSYTCWYGTHEVPIGECYIYAEAFDPDNWADGTTYADPDDGTVVDSPTSPTETDRLTRDLIARGWDDWRTPNYDSTQGNRDQTAKAIAAACVGLALVDECRLKPIFSPGINVLEAAQHDSLAILAGYPAELHYMTQAEKLAYDGTASGWYAGNSSCSKPVGDDRECDEYPFLTSTEGGPTAVLLGRETDASLSLIDADDNRNEGQYLIGFKNTCNMTQGAPHSYAFPNPAREYLVIPILALPTSFWCARPGSE